MAQLSARSVGAAEVDTGERTEAAARVDVTSTTLSGWHTGPTRYGEVFERLNLGVGWNAWQAGVRLDSASFAQAPSPNVSDRYAVEKVWAAWTGRSLELSAGDAYVSFGRGLALSLRKVDELGLDTTLRGAKLLVHSGRVSGTLAVGYTNTNNVDEATGKSMDDPRDLIGGLRVETGVADSLTLGLHAAAFAFREPLGLVPGQSYHDRYFAFGPSINAPRVSDWLGFYVEGIAQARETATEPTSPLGLGLYGSATSHVGRATLLLEGKAYGDLEPIKPQVSQPEFSTVAYNNPPTVERLLQIIENPQKHIAGGRVRVDWNLSPLVMVYVNYGFFRDWQGYADPVSLGSIRPGDIHDPYVGLEAHAIDGRSWLQTSAGWRTVVLDDSRAVVRGDAHIEADAAQALAGRWSATIHALFDYRRKYESALLDERFGEGSFLAGVRITPWGAIAAGYDYTGDPTQPKHDYWNGNLEWNVTSASSLRLFVGGTRGGLRCVSGVCRLFPPFEGVRLSVTVRI